MATEMRKLKIMNQVRDYSEATVVVFSMVILVIEPAVLLSEH